MASSTTDQATTSQTLDARGHAYAAKHLSLLENAFTQALQAVLTEQPSDPLAWVAGFLGEYAAERAGEEKEPTTVASMRRKDAVAQALAVLGGHADTWTTGKKQSADEAEFGHTIMPLPSAAPIREAMNPDNVTDAVLRAAAPPEKVGSPKDRQVEAEQILVEVRKALQERCSARGGGAALQLLMSKLEEADTGRQGTVRKTEFLKAFTASRLSIEAGKLSKLHAHFDTRGQGEVTISEFARALTAGRMVRRTSMLLQR